MVRVIKSKVKIKEMPEEFKIVKKQEQAEQAEEDEEEGQDSSLENSGFMPRRSSSGLEAPVLEASGGASQNQTALLSPGRERKKENEGIAVPEYQTASVYNMPDYSPSQTTRRQQTRPEAVLHTTLASEAGQRQTTRMQDWHELSQARQQSPSGRQEAVIGISQLDRDNKLPFQQDSKYNPRKKAV